jgi:hypothetical protein
MIAIKLSLLRKKGDSMKTAITLDFSRHLDFAEGHRFGDTGPYERLAGRINFELDPEDLANQNIVDLDKVSKNKSGLVEFSADLDILKPVNLNNGNHRLLYDVNNRGNRTILRTFNDAVADSDPSKLSHAGNGFLMRQGYTIVWSGWQGDLEPDGKLLTAELPQALEGGHPLQGRVRQEFIVDQPGVYSMPLSGAASIRSYPAVSLDTAHASLTCRERETDPRQLLPTHQWAFAEANQGSTGNQINVTPSSVNLYLVSGFKPGWIYELIYATEGSQVMGLGLVGIRDLVGFLRYDNEDSKGMLNPLAGAIEKAYGYGSSLCARVLRQSIYDGYNVDPVGRRVFDAVYPHVSGGGRVFANIRFAQVGRFPRQHEEHQWPSERYPFAYSAVPDPFTEGLDSVLKRPKSDPLIIHTHTGTEYWQRHASLGHTDPRNGDDLEFPENVRVYALASAHHGGMPGASQQLANTMTVGPFLRANLIAMDNWATIGTEPPFSLVPKKANNTLATPDRVLENFPNIPGVNTPSWPSRLPKYDYGPNFDRGVVTENPPKPIPGQEYILQVPQVDVDGNEIAGVRSPEIEAPVGTHTGWSLRKAGLAEGEMYSLTGSFIPFTRTKQEREATGDPRLSIEERYGSHADYVKAISHAVENLLALGFILKEDAERYFNAANERNPLDPDVPLRPLVLSTQ